VDRFLEHTLFITQDHLRSLDLEKALETIVTNDHTTIKVVKIGRSEAAAIEGNEGTQLRRNNRNVLHYHPLGTVSDPCICIAECFHNAKTLQRISLSLLRSFCGSSIAKVKRKLIEVDACEHVVYSFSTHLRDELVGIIIRQVL